MGFLVEVLFHVLPLSLLLFITGALFKNINHERLIWGSIAIVALLEPVYQVVFMESALVWAKIVTGVNLFLFNLTQLTIFKRYDFISMYLSRLIYYAIWHILWGHLRLELLY